MNFAGTLAPPIIFLGGDAPKNTIFGGKLLAPIVISHFLPWAELRDFKDAKRCKSSQKAPLLEILIELEKSYERK